MNTSTIIAMIQQDQSILNDIDGFVSRMNAGTVRHEDHQRKTYSDLTEHFTLEELPLLDAALGNGFSWVQRALGGIGIDFASPAVENGLAALVKAGKITEEMAARIRAIGVTYTSIADANGGECTRRNVEDAIAIMRRQPLLAEAEARYQAVVSAIHAGEITDSAALAQRII